MDAKILKFPMKAKTQSELLDQLVSVLSEQEVEECFSVFVKVFTKLLQEATEPEERHAETIRFLTNNLHGALTNQLRWKDKTNGEEILSLACDISRIIDAQPINKVSPAFAWIYTKLLHESIPPDHRTATIVRDFIEIEIKYILKNLKDIYGWEI